MDRKESTLLDEQLDTEQIILEKLDTLIDAKWDAHTIQIEIESLMKQRHKIISELIDLDEG